MQRLTLLAAMAALIAGLALTPTQGVALAQPIRGMASAAHEDDGRHRMGHGEPSLGAHSRAMTGRNGRRAAGSRGRVWHNPSMARGARYRPLPHVSPRLRPPHSRPECELGLHGCEGRDGTRHGVY